VLERLAPHVYLDDIVGKIKGFYARGKISLNHALAEVVIAHYLRAQGFKHVDVEHNIAPRIVCDVYGELERGKLCVEIEYGFVPPEYATEPNSYLRARIAKKIATISQHVDILAFAIPPHYIPPIPLILLRPPCTRSRSRRGLSDLISLIKRFYPDSDIEATEKILTRAEIGFFLIVDIDRGKVAKLTPQQMEILLTTIDSFLT